MTWHDLRTADDANMRSMQALRPRMCYADLERMPDDGRRYELYDGELSEVPAPIPRHQRVAFKVAEQLIKYERSHGGLMFSSPIDIVLDDHNVVQPDVVFFSADRTAAIGMSRAIRTPPDLAVEVLSPSTAAADRGKKLRLLARFGLKEYWLVDPLENTLEQFVANGLTLALHRRVRREDVLDSPTLPGLEVPTVRLFDV